MASSKQELIGDLYIAQDEIKSIIKKMKDYRTGASDWKIEEDALEIERTLETINTLIEDSVHLLDFGQDWPNDEEEDDYEVELTDEEKEKLESFKPKGD